MDIVLLGSGGQADEAESFLPTDVRVIFRAIDPEFMGSASSARCVDIYAFCDTEAVATAAVGAPGLRKQLVEKWGGRNYYSIIAGSSEIAESTIIEDGCIVAPGAIVTTNSVIGRHTILNVAVTIGHNCDVGKYVTISPGVNIAGNVRIGDGVFVGIGEP
jgi:acetyltransferase-like isoleucine patch superfamily enzyme